GKIEECRGSDRMGKPDPSKNMGKGGGQLCDQPADGFAPDSQRRVASQRRRPFFDKIRRGRDSVGGPRRRDGAGGGNPAQEDDGNLPKNRCQPVVHAAGRGKGAADGNRLDQRRSGPPGEAGGDRNPGEPGPAPADSPVGDAAGSGRRSVRWKRDGMSVRRKFPRQQGQGAEVITDAEKKG